MSVNKRSNAEWRELIAKCESSGKGQETWCIENGVNYYTFVDRARRLRRMDEQGESGVIFKAKREWVEVKEASDSELNDVDQDSREDRELITEESVIRIELGQFTVSVADGFSDAALTRVLRVVVGVCEDAVL